MLFFGCWSFFPFFKILYKGPGWGLSGRGGQFLLNFLWGKGKVGVGSENQKSCEMQEIR